MEDLFKDRRLILAPMAGVTDEVFRELCIEAGAQLTYTEMVSAKALSYGSGKTRDLLVLAPSEKQVALQIFGHEPETMAQEAYELEQMLGHAVFSFDVNMGCPARKIAGKGDGAALMRDPMLASRIVEAMANKVEHPVTVKMRRGFAFGEETAPELAHIVQESGLLQLRSMALCPAVLSRRCLLGNDPPRERCCEDPCDRQWRYHFWGAGTRHAHRNWVRCADDRARGRR